MTTAIGRLRRTPRSRLTGDDSGVTLIDVMVAMTLMSVLLAVFTAGIIDMYRTANRAESTAEAQTRTVAAFNRLERQIRYAERITKERLLPNNDYVVEFAMNDSVNALQCIQLRIPENGGDLTARQWTAGSTPTKPATTVVTGITRPSPAEPPFTRKAAGSAGSNFDRLVVQVTTTVGGDRNEQTRAFDLQFTALNTVPTSIDLPTCSVNP
jgi:Tfp pilus assembly protein PilV